MKGITWIALVMALTLLRAEGFFRSPLATRRQWHLEAGTAEEPVEELKSQDSFLAVTSKTQSANVIVVDFVKSHCKPCIKVAPEFEKLAKSLYGSGAEFFKVDADTSKESLAILKSEGIRSVPTFQVWQNGMKVDTIQGAHVDEVEECVQGLLAILAKKQQP
jgi:thioredoxin 1